jgi:hexosaminidase
VLKNLLILFLLIGTLISCSDTATPEKVALIPLPSELSVGVGSFEMNSKTVIVASGEAVNTATYLQQFLKKATGFNLDIVANKSENSISLSLDGENLNSEGYSVVVEKDIVSIKASANPGLFYGVQTLRQLLPTEIESGKVVENIKWRIPCVTIDDKPRFKYRGMMLDVARHFFSTDYIKRYLDYMALYKMNTFHMHLTDDQGWRIEIKKYPKLTQKGAFRTKNSQDKECDLRAKENPDMVITPEFFKVVDGENVYGGFYTQEEIKEIIEYAKVRNITIIPEIDMPGHFMSAIENYPEVSCFGKADWGQSFSTPLCAGNEKTYEMVENILAEVVDLFPSSYVHIGADEVEKINWEKCPKCQAKIKKEKLANEHELHSYFVHRIEDFLKSKGKKMIGWDEILEGGMSKTATMMYWRGWEPDAPLKAAKQGNDVIMSPSTHYYFHEEQDGGSLMRVYGFEPVPEGLTAEEAKHILGGQGCIWTEYIPSEARVDYMAVPRMIALAETLWSPKKQKDWKTFVQRIGLHFDRLDVMKVNYRLPDMGGLFEDNVFVTKANVAFTSQLSNPEIYYTTDGTVPDKESKLYTGPFEITNNITLKVRQFGKGSARGDILEARFVEGTYANAMELENVKRGLKCDYYEGKNWRTGVVDIGKSDIWKGSFETNSFEWPEVAVKRHASFALVYNGYIHVEKDDIYTFSLLCDDAGVLKIADKVVVDNDGKHGPIKKTAQVALRKGWHKIELKYIEAGGGGVLGLTMLDNSGQFSEISGEQLAH